MAGSKKFSRTDDAEERENEDGSLPNVFVIFEDIATLLDSSLSWEYWKVCKYLCNYFNGSWSLWIQNIVKYRKTCRQRCCSAWKIISFQNSVN